MPVRSLNSSVLKWPDRPTIDSALRDWVAQLIRSRREVLRVGYFGSYARDDWGVGSDLDLVIVVNSSSQPFVRRSAEYDATTLPVPADVLVYTEDEWRSMNAQSARPLEREIIWISALKADG